MKSDYVSLYLASVDTRRSLLLLGAWASAPFVNSDKRRHRLAKAVQTQVGVREVFAYGSARGALAACLQGAGVGPGDKVLLSSFTCLAVPTAVLAVGARPVYVDIDPVSLCTRAKDIIGALESDVRAVVIQHTMGRIAEVEPVVEEAKKRGILVIEDCALSLGSWHAGKPAGSFGDAAIFSMELSKTVSTGWGGILTVKDSLLAHRVAENYARLPEPSFWETTRRVWQVALSGICYEPAVFPLGRYLVAAAYRLGIFKPSTPPEEIEGRPNEDFISRLSGCQSVLGAQQWLRLGEVAAKCRQNAECLRKRITAAGLCILAEPEPGDVAVTPRVPFIVESQSQASSWFAANDVELGTWFDGPLSPLPDSASFEYDPGDYFYSNMVAKHVVNLASHCRLNGPDLERMATLLLKYVQAYPAERAFAEQFANITSID